jgi:hypothetical protein
VQVDGRLIDAEVGTTLSMRESVILDDAEIERRKPVWEALSDLWLDTELTEDDLRRIADVMRRSAYPIDMLRHIYLFEVAPVVFGNLFCVAGTWSGFDQEWLFDEVAKRARKRSPILRLMVKLGIGKQVLTFDTERHWNRLVEMLAPERD